MRDTVHIGGTPRSETPVLSEKRRSRLLAYGLNETDLAFMGPNQRAMVEAILARESGRRVNH